MGVKLTDWEVKLTNGKMEQYVADNLICKFVKDRGGYYLAVHSGTAEYQHFRRLGFPVYTECYDLPIPPAVIMLLDGPYSFEDALRDGCLEEGYFPANVVYSSGNPWPSVISIRPLGNYASSASEVRRRTTTDEDTFLWAVTAMDKPPRDNIRLNFLGVCTSYELAKDFAEAKAKMLGKDSEVTWTSNRIGEVGNTFLMLTETRLVSSPNQFEEGAFFFGGDWADVEKH